MPLQRSGSRFAIRKTTFLDESYAYEIWAKKLIQGVKFTVPASMATGTNLSADSYVSVEWLPRAKSCTGDIYLQATVKAGDVTEGGSIIFARDFNRRRSGQSIRGVGLCRCLQAPLHRSALLHPFHQSRTSPLGAVLEFNKKTLLAEFDKIRASLELSNS